MTGSGAGSGKATAQVFLQEGARLVVHGLTDAKRLQGADYDLDVVTPDADNWKYGPFF